MEKPVARLLFHCSLCRQTGHLSLQRFIDPGRIYENANHLLCLALFCVSKPLLCVCGLFQIQEQKIARKQAEEALITAQQADKAKAADLRTAYQQHQDEVHRIKRDCEKDIRRLVRRHAAGKTHTSDPLSVFI